MKTSPMWIDVNQSDADCYQLAASLRTSSRSGLFTSGRNRSVVFSSIAANC